MDEELVVVGEFLDPSEVHLAKHLQAVAGIRCAHPAQVLVFQRGVVGGVKLIIRRLEERQRV